MNEKMNQQRPGGNILLATIAVEPNRWTADKNPWFELKDLLHPVSESGFRAVELWEYHIRHLSPKQLDVLLELGSENDVDFLAMALYPKLFDTDFGTYIDDVFRQASRLGVRKLKIFAGDRGSANLSPAEREYSLARIRQLVRAGMDLGITVSTELHQDTLCDSVDAALQTVAELDGTINICFQPLDFSNQKKTMEDFRRLAPHVDHIHLQGRSDGEFHGLENADINYGELLPLARSQSPNADYCIEFVQDCIVADPQLFDLTKVLSNACRDLEYVGRVLTNSSC